MPTSSLITQHSSLVTSSSSALIIAPHPDDESIGCGGAAMLLREQGIDVSVILLTSGEGASRELPREQVWAVREAEAISAAEILGVNILGFLRQPDGQLNDRVDLTAAAVADLLRGGGQLERVYLPHPGEDHPDHEACLPIVAAAFSILGWEEPWLLGYEVWTPLARYDTVEDVSAVFDRKLSAVRAHQSQLKQFEYDRAVAGLNAYRGVTAGRCRYAEVFSSLSFG